jgi:hypothetical protein
MSTEPVPAGERRVPGRLPGARICPAPFALVLFAGIAFAQIYPPGMPPVYPGQRPYPGTGRTQGQIPAPSNGTKANEPLPNFRGVLRQMDAKTITLKLGDDRVLEFKRTDKTRFFKNGDEIKAPEFKPGDQVSIEGPEDQSGYMTAVNVYWEKAASAAGAAADKSEGGVDAWNVGDEAPSAGTEVKPPPAKPDPTDPGPPQLRRGKPADQSREHAPDTPEDSPAQQAAAARVPPAETAAARPIPTAPASAARRDEELPFGGRQTDPLIRKAADAALDFTETLPNYVCQEVVGRSQSQTRPANWQPVDVVTTEVVYENGKEDYRNVMIDGRPSKKKVEEVGAWSTGEFGTVLIDLFSPATATDFRPQGTSRMAGINAKEYTFEVARENSHWNVKMGSQSYRPPYDGAVWIDPATSRVLRIEMSGKGFPQDFPCDHVESATDYQYVRLGGTEQYLLPVHSEMLTCERGTNNCSKNVIDFRNYHKFEGESTIKYGDPK